MKYVLALLVFFNVAVFVLQLNYNKSNNSNPSDDVMAESGDIPNFINQLTAIRGECQNLGPFDEEFIAQEIIKEGSNQDLLLKLVYEPEYTLMVYRVFVGPATLSDIERLKSQLSDIYEGAFVIVGEGRQQGVLSIGIFGFIQTAFQIRDNLRNNGFDADITDETLKRKSRYWVQSSKEVNGLVLSEIAIKVNSEQKFLISDGDCV